MKGYKTFAFNLLMTGGMGIHLMTGGQADLPSAEQVAGGVDAVATGLSAIWGLGNLYLRAVTNTPIFRKD